MELHYPRFLTTGKKLFFELICINIASLFGGVFYFDMSVEAIATIVVLSAVPFIVYTVYKLYKSPKTLYTEVLFAPTKKESILLISIWVVSMVALVLTVQNSLLVRISVVASFLYILRILLLYYIYNGKFLGYTSKESDSSYQWYEASSVLTKSRISKKQNNIIRQLIWGVIAVGRYQRVISSIDGNINEYEMKGARDYLLASKQNVKSSIFLNKRSTYEYRYQSIKTRAMNKLDYSRCSYCKSVEKNENLSEEKSTKSQNTRLVCRNCLSDYEEIDCENCGSNVQRIDIIDENYCSYCYPEKSVNSGTAHKPGNKTLYQKYIQVKPDRTDVHIDNSFPSELQRAITMLEIVPPITKTKIEDAYREKAKRIHPDSEYGSKEQFKELSHAKEELLEYVK